MAGHSYGGLLARLFALEYPKEVAGVVAVDPSPEDETCTNAPCPLSPDVQTIRKLEGGKVAGSLGDRPLVVISHSPDLPFWDPASNDATWEQLGAETVTASSNARHVAAARAPKHTLASCGPAFTQLGGLCQ